MSIVRVGKSGMYAVLKDGLVIRLFPRKPTAQELYLLALELN